MLEQNFESYARLHRAKAVCSVCLFFFLSQVFMGFPGWVDVAASPLLPTASPVLVLELETPLSLTALNELQKAQWALARALRAQLAHKQMALSEDETERLWQNISKEAFNFTEAATTGFLDFSQAGYFSAQKAYFDFEFERCIQRLEKTQSELKNLNVDLFLAPEMPYRLSLLKAVCHLGQNAAVQAREAFLEALHERPNLELRGLNYSPQVMSAFSEAKQLFLLQNTLPTRTQVSIQSEPPFMAVFLNGMPVGQTPLTLDHELGGNYLLKLSGSGFRDGFVRYQAPSREPLQFTVRMEKAVAANAESSPKRRFVLRAVNAMQTSEWWNELSYMSELLGAEQILLVGIDENPGGSGLQVWRVQPKMRECVGVIDFENNNLQADVDTLISKLALLALKDKPAALVPRRSRSITWAQKSTRRDELGESQFAVPSETSAQPPLFAETAPAIEKKFYQRWWFWSIVAIVIAGAASGTAMALSQSSSGGSGGNTSSSQNPSGGVVVQKRF